MKVLYFAWLRGRVGTGEEELFPPAEVETVGDLITWLKTQSSGHAQAFAEGSVIRVAVNQDYAGLDHPIHPTDEIAFFPPVTGG